MQDYWARQHVKNCACSICNFSNLLILGEEKKCVNLIGGFLGAGKTTMVNNILSQPLDRQVHVIVKEFGAISVDDKLLNIEKACIHPFTGASLHVDQQTMLTSFIENLYAASDRHPFDNLLIEASGAESAEQLVQIFYLPRSRDHYQLASFITVVDGEFGRLNLEEFRTAREQIVLADYLVINKCDCVDEAEINALIRELRKLNPFAEIIKTSFGKVDAEKLLRADHYEQLRNMENKEEVETGMDEFRTVSLYCREALDKEKVDLWIRDLYDIWGKTLLRGKGYFNIQGSDYRFDFQSVRTNFHAKTEERWEDKENRETVVVLIGTELPSREELMDSLTACVAGNTYEERKLA